MVARTICPIHINCEEGPLLVYFEMVIFFIDLDSMLTPLKMGTKNHLGNNGDWCDINHVTIQMPICL